MRSYRDNLSSGIGIFGAVVDAGTFAAAADMMDMSPPGVSRAIARLEARLGIRLFHRTTRSVSLTDEGRRFYEQVMPHLRGMEEAAANAKGSAVLARGKLRINVDPVFSGLLLGPKLDEFMARHRDLTLEFLSRDHLGDLVVEGFDLALRFGEPRMSGLVARKLLDTAVVTVAAPGYLAAHGRPKTPQDLQRGHTCLEFRNPETGKPYPWEFHRPRKKVTVETNGRLTVNDPAALLKACLAGSGVAQMLLLVAAPLIRDGQLIDLFPDWAEERFPLFAYHPSRHHMPAKTRVFLDFVVSVTASTAATATS